MKYADAHADTFYEIAEHGYSPLIEDSGLHVTLPRMKRVGQILQCCSVFTPARYSGPDAEKFARNVIATLEHWAKIEPAFCKVSNAEDLANIDDGRMRLIPWLEGASPLRGELGLLDEFYALGVRGIGLVHNHRNEVADGCGCSEPLGLSDFGRELIARMDELGVAVDLAHMPEPGFSDVVETATKPLIITHTGCRGLVDISRNASDKMLRAVADSGGLVGIDFYPGHVLSGAFGKNIRRATVDDIAEHVAYAVNVCGADHVCIGGDFDGFKDTCENLEHVGQIPNLIDALIRKGITQADAEKILAHNLLSFMTAILKR